jgi:hypothetical protein
MTPWNWKWRLMPDHFGFLIPLKQQAKKGAMVLAEVIDPDCQGEIGILFHDLLEYRRSLRASLSIAMPCCWKMTIIQVVL